MNLEADVVLKVYQEKVNQLIHENLTLKAMLNQKDLEKQQSEAEKKENK